MYLDRGLLCVGSHLPASAESGSRTPEWLLALYTSTQYTDCTPSAQSSILGSTLSCVASVRRHCGVPRRRGGDCGVCARPPEPVVQPLVCPITCLLRLYPHTAHIYKCTIATRTRCKAHSPRRHSGVSSAVGLCRPWSHTAPLLSHARRHPHTAALTHRPHTRCPRTRCPYASP